VGEYDSSVQSNSNDDDSQVSLKVHWSYPYDTGNNNKCRVKPEINNSKMVGDHRGG